jgi:hypothetical protein
MNQLAAAGIPFLAREDSRLESEGSQCVFISWRKKAVYLQEDGNGFPVVPVQNNGKIEKRHLDEARQFQKLRNKFFAYALKTTA